MHVSDGVRSDQRDRIDQSQPHLRLEDFVDSTSAQLSGWQASRRNWAGDCIDAAVLVLQGDAPRRCDVDGQPSNQRPEVCSADGVAVLLEDGLEEFVHDGAGHSAERDQACVLCSVAQAAIGTELVRLRHVDFPCVVERQSQRLPENVRSREIVRAGRPSDWEQTVEGCENILVSRADVRR